MELLSLNLGFLFFISQLFITSAAIITSIHSIFPKEFFFYNHLFQTSDNLKYFIPLWILQISAIIMIYIDNSQTNPNYLVIYSVIFAFTLYLFILFIKKIPKSNRLAKEKGCLIDINFNYLDKSKYLLIIISISFFIMGFINRFLESESFISSIFSVIFLTIISIYPLKHFFFLIDLNKRFINEIEDTKLLNELISSKINLNPLVGNQLFFSYIENPKYNYFKNKIFGEKDSKIECFVDIKNPYFEHIIFYHSQIFSNLITPVDKILCKGTRVIFEIGNIDFSKHNLNDDEIKRFKNQTVDKMFIVENISTTYNMRLGKSVSKIHLTTALFQRDENTDFLYFDINLMTSQGCYILKPPSDLRKKSFEALERIAKRKFNL